MSVLSGSEKKRIKILHLIDSGGLYGAEKMLLSLCNEQIKQGLDVAILSCGELGEAPKAIELESERLGISCIPWRMKSGLNLSGGKSLRKFARDNGYSFFHSHGYKFNILLGLYPRSIREIPVVATVHGYVAPRRLTKMWFNLLIDRWCLSRLDRVIFVSSAMKSQESFKTLNLKRYTVVENGIDSGLFEAVIDKTEGDRFLDSYSGDGLVVGYIGRLSSEKGVGLLLESFAHVANRIENVRLLMCGDGPEADGLRKKAIDIGISNQVDFVGYIKNVPAALKRIDVFVMPSLTEGMPMVLMEAIEENKSIVATKVGGMPEMLEGGALGALVEPGNIDMLSSELISILSRMDDCYLDPSIKSAFDKSKKRFSAAGMADKYLAVYAQLLAEEKG